MPISRTCRHCFRDGAAFSYCQSTFYCKPDCYVSSPCRCERDHFDISASGFWDGGLASGLLGKLFGEKKDLQAMFSEFPWSTYVERGISLPALNDLIGACHKMEQMELIELRAENETYIQVYSEFVKKFRVFLMEVWKHIGTELGAKYDGTIARLHKILEAAAIGASMQPQSQQHLHFTRVFAREIRENTIDILAVIYSSALGFVSYSLSALVAYHNSLQTIVYANETLFSLTKQGDPEQFDIWLSNLIVLCKTLETNDDFTEFYRTLPFIIANPTNHISFSGMLWMLKDLIGNCSNFAPGILAFFCAGPAAIPYCKLLEEISDDTAFSGPKEFSITKKDAKIVAAKAQNHPLVNSLNDMIKQYKRLLRAACQSIPKTPYAAVKHQAWRESGKLVIREPGEGKLDALLTKEVLEFSILHASMLSTMELIESDLIRQPADIEDDGKVYIKGRTRDSSPKRRTKVARKKVETALDDLGLNESHMVKLENAATAKVQEALHIDSVNPTTIFSSIISSVTGFRARHPVALARLKNLGGSMATQYLAVQLVSQLETMMPIHLLETAVTNAVELINPTGIPEVSKALAYVLIRGSKVAGARKVVRYSTLGARQLFKRIVGGVDLPSDTYGNPEDFSKLHREALRFIRDSPRDPQLFTDSSPVDFVSIVPNSPLLVNSDEFISYILKSGKQEWKAQAQRRLSRQVISCADKLGVSQGEFYNQVSPLAKEILLLDLNKIGHSFFISPPISRAELAFLPTTPLDIITMLRETAVVSSLLLSADRIGDSVMQFRNKILAHTPRTSFATLSLLKDYSAEVLLNYIPAVLTQHKLCGKVSIDMFLSQAGFSLALLPAMFKYGILTGPYDNLLQMGRASAGASALESKIWNVIQYYGEPSKRIVDELSIDLLTVQPTEWASALVVRNIAQYVAGRVERDGRYQYALGIDPHKLPPEKLDRLESAFQELLESRIQAKDEGKLNMQHSLEQFTATTARIQGLTQGLLTEAIKIDAKISI